MNFRRRLKNGDGQLKLRLKLLGLAAAPLLLAVIALIWMIPALQKESEERAIEAVKPIVLKARRDEIQHMVQAGKKALTYFCKAGANDPRMIKEGLALIRSMEFGDKKTDDNYFFVYKTDGTSVMHARKPEIVGTNLWNMTDQTGKFLIQELIGQAMVGGGFVEYYWTRPSTKQDEPKLGYADLIPECDWMIGTGLYLDQLREAEDAIRTETRLQFSNTRDKILLIALASLLLVAAGGLAVNLSEQRNANAKLRAMAQKVVQSQEAERTRVARELHDGVSQSLASVKFIFESADIQLDRGKLEGASKAMKAGVAQIIDAMIEVRRISHDLYPTILDDQGLGVALKQLAREFQTRTGIPVSVDIKDAKPIQREASKTLYRFVQQALGNIEAHARASGIRIQMRQGNGLELRVTDDGVGFDVHAMQENRSGGLGLVSMRERIEMLGGGFAVTSRPGQTTVQAFLPPESIQI